MGLDLWFREDVARILAATQETMRALTEAVAPAGAEGQGSAAAYQQGFGDALRAVGVAFGLAGPMDIAGPPVPRLDGPAWKSGRRR
jgi:hypothetical protein